MSHLETNLEVVHAMHTDEGLALWRDLRLQLKYASHVHLQWRLTPLPPLSRIDGLPFVGRAIYIGVELALRHGGFEAAREAMRALRTILTAASTLEEIDDHLEAFRDGALWIADVGETAYARQAVDVSKGEPSSRVDE